MKLLIIRHGESGADLLDVHEGRADFELTRKGHDQSIIMSQWIMSNYQIDKIYHSPLKRALQTAQHLSEVSKAPLCADDDLMEFNNGLLAGMPKKEAAEKYPAIPDLPISEAVYEQETKMMFRYRADMILTKIIHDNKDKDTIAIITHGGMINQLYHSFLQMPVAANYTVHTGDTGVHYWAIVDGQKHIIYSNKDSHLVSMM